ncbi:MAG TPA: ABC transporter permease [Trueperaceae bacterium]|nr:ABC transporter permease [Trueperaceae bacterium]
MRSERAIANGGAAYRAASALTAGRNVVRRLLRRPVGWIAGSIVTAYVLVAVLAPLLAPYAPGATDLAARLTPPSAHHWFGTDALGRDTFSRTLFGARVSLLVGFLTVTITSLFGTLLGAFAGFVRGPFDNVTARLTELLQAFPYLIFAIAMMAFLGPGFWNLIWALSLKGWVEFYRLARGEALAQSATEYVEAARALGQRRGRTLLRELLPNIVPSIMVLGTLRVGYFMVLEASLSFLGVGIPPSIPAWGSMVAEGRNVLFIAWWVSTIPGIALLVLVLAINLLGERLQEVLDPHRRVSS